MPAIYDSGFYDEANLFIKERPLPEGTLVCYKDMDDKACSGRVKAAGMYILWVEDLQNRDVTTFIRYTDLVWVLGQW
jgi:hypothetical protein